MCGGKDKIGVCMVVLVVLVVLVVVVVVVGKDIHKTSSIEDSRVVKQCVICGHNNI